MSDNQLSEYVSGRLSDSERARLQRVLDSCDSCRDELLNWEATRAALRDLPELGLPRSFVMLEAPAPVSPPAPAMARSRETGFRPLAGLGRLPALSPWVYAGAASLVALAGALIVTTQGGLPWAGPGEGLMSDAASEQAGLAMAPRSDSGPESLQVSRPQSVPAPPQIAAAPAGQVEKGDDRVSAMAARSMLTKEAASRKVQGVPQDIGKVAPPLRRETEAEPEVALEASSEAAAPMAQATMAPQVASAESVPAAVPASAEVETITSEEPQSAQSGVAKEFPAVEAQAEAGTDAPAVAGAAAEPGDAPRLASGYASDAAQVPTSTPAAVVSASTSAPEAAPAPDVLKATGQGAITPAPGQVATTALPSDGGEQSSQDKASLGEGQETSPVESEGAAEGMRTTTPAHQLDGAVAGGSRGVEQVPVTVEPIQEEQTAGETTATDEGAKDTELETGDREPTPAPGESAATDVPATALFSPESVRKITVSPQGEMTERTREERRAVPTSPATGAIGPRGDGAPAERRATEDTGPGFAWVLGGLLALVALALAGYLGYRVNRSRKAIE